MIRCTYLVEDRAWWIPVLYTVLLDPLVLSLLLVFGLLVWRYACLSQFFDLVFQFGLDMFNTAFLASVDPMSLDLPRFFPSNNVLIVT